MFVIVARAVFQVGLEVSGCEGALEAMAHICDQLSSIREDKREAMKALQDKKHNIDQFTQIAVSGPAVVCVCVCPKYAYNDKHVFDDPLPNQCCCASTCTLV